MATTKAYNPLRGLTELVMGRVGLKKQKPPTPPVPPRLGPRNIAARTDPRFAMMDFLLGQTNGGMGDPKYDPFPNWPEPPGFKGEWKGEEGLTYRRDYKALNNKAGRIGDDAYMKGVIELKEKYGVALNENERTILEATTSGGAGGQGHGGGTSTPVAPPAPSGNQAAGAIPSTFDQEYDGPILPDDMEGQHQVTFKAEYKRQQIGSLSKEQQDAFFKKHGLYRSPNGPFLVYRGKTSEQTQLDTIRNAARQQKLDELKGLVEEGHYGNTPSERGDLKNLADPRRLDHALKIARERKKTADSQPKTKTEPRPETPTPSFPEEPQGHGMTPEEAAELKRLQDLAADMEANGETSADRAKGRMANKRLRSKGFDSRQHELEWLKSFLEPSQETPIPKSKNRLNVKPAQTQQKGPGTGSGKDPILAGMGGGDQESPPARPETRSEEQAAGKAFMDKVAEEAEKAIAGKTGDELNKAKRDFNTQLSNTPGMTQTRARQIKDALRTHHGLDMRADPVAEPEQVTKNIDRSAEMEAQLGSLTIAEYHNWWEGLSEAEKEEYRRSMSVNMGIRSKHKTKRSQFYDGTMTDAQATMSDQEYRDWWNNLKPDKKQKKQEQNRFRGMVSRDTWNKHLNKMSGAAKREKLAGDTGKEVEKFVPPDYGRIFMPGGGTSYGGEARTYREQIEAMEKEKEKKRLARNQAEIDARTEREADEAMLEQLYREWYGNNFVDGYRVGRDPEPTIEKARQERQRMEEERQRRQVDVPQPPEQPAETVHEVHGGTPHSPAATVSPPAIKSPPSTPRNNRYINNALIESARSSRRGNVPSVPPAPILPPPRYRRTF